MDQFRELVRRPPLVCAARTAIVPASADRERGRHGAARRRSTPAHRPGRQETGTRGSSAWALLAASLNIARLHRICDYGFARFASPAIHGGFRIEAPIEITMRDDGGELDGTIGSAGGPDSASASSPGPRAFVYCVPLAESTGQFQPLVVSEDGKFSAQMMAPGDYRIVAFSVPQPNLPYRDAEAMKPYESQGQVVHMSAGQKTTVQLQNVIRE